MEAPCQSAFWFLAAIYLIVGFIMKYTMLGRGIYAVGGDPVAAERAGFNVSFIRIFVFTFMGAIGGITGITQVTVSGMCQINFFDGYEMTIIAAVVAWRCQYCGWFRLGDRNVPRCAPDEDDLK